MITQIQNLPPNMVGFKASYEVTQTDFTEDVMPKVKELVAKTDTLNYMLVLDTSVKNFIAGAWFKDTVMGVKYLTKWHRAAIVSDIHVLKIVTDVFSVLMPGEFKVFEHKDLQISIDWVSGQN